ncbi:hypothetical protein QQF64_001331 [Cirrhinus molitorella]|uniref:Uncharacterized protein n=2 Tax=Cirrhinus molitorella TaxID=172907 RepID=A0AA88Q2K7_9TELE|nr:hypothetical protein Q8A67_004581 [Cirrhinus molitorella]
MQMDSTSACWDGVFLRGGEATLSQLDIHTHQVICLSIHPSEEREERHHHEILPSAVSPPAAADSPVHHQRRKTRFSQPEAEISQTQLSKETLSTSSLQSAIPLRFHNYTYDALRKPKSSDGWEMREEFCIRLTEDCSFAHVL